VDGNGYGSPGAAVQAMSDAVLAVAAEVEVEPILQRLVDAARELAGARYAALGVPDGAGGFARFLTSGMSDETAAAIGPLPRTHGLLGAMLESADPHRTENIRSDPRFGGWPAHHPWMTSFLGVPIVSKGEVIGAFYLTNREGAGSFSDDDQSVIEMLAAHAAIAIENGRLYERSRELSVIEERNRLARELHDAVAQTLFSVVLTAEAAATLVDRDPQAAKERLAEVQRLASDAVRELRSLVFELRPAELEAEGLVPTLVKHVEVLRRVHRREIELEVEGARRLPLEVEGEIFRIVQEALSNALRHAQAAHVRASLRIGGDLVEAAVGDDGVGFDPAAARSRRLGLTSMEERAARIGGSLSVESRPGAGTEVRLTL
jgi:signal transduction histidine kinase